MTTLLLGLDAGTTGARAVAVDESGKLLASASAGYELSMPRPGWTEQDPALWWEACRRVLAEVSEACAGDFAGLGLTGQMHGSVFLDEAGVPIRPALLWNDQRTAGQCEEITELVGPSRLLEIAGNPALTGFQAPKILWLREEEPEAYTRVRHVLLPKDYLRYRLTGELITDVSDASGTLLLDVRARGWSPELLELLGVPRKWLPEVRESPELAGRLRPEVAAELGLPAGLPVAAGAGDNAAAAVGIGVIGGGLASSSIGTSGVLFVHTDEFTPDPSGRVHAFGHAVPGAYHVMGVTLAAGASLGWWRSIIGQDMSYDDLAALAGSAPPGSEGLVFLPHLFGERSPHLDPRARGLFLGLTARHTGAHLTRAVMEGVVFSLRQCLDVVRTLGVPVSEIRATGGGARNPLWLQLQADIYGIAVTRMAVDEGPAYGAALLAGVAAGVFPDLARACGPVQVSGTFEPNQRHAEIYDRAYAVYRDLYPALREPMHRLSTLAEGASG
ncbi:MAG: xylulokinase [Candidatus Nephthysia bennettiae]|uniref:Xylulose kinase n=1 Tax=Candidatus Nephthysia bennettiae TaxID=3127016 RepID=A0A934JZ02_9BACT|nr:xylulokinase [Candidatus Dormibacteraeota bacterium]MBJ7614956.1 xylulokinase [Candidatus Dormibacteraeota bacterium]PZR99934.1 MAG: xylulokinase [Candidatus Dormibacteraeota bacterium]